MTNVYFIRHAESDTTVHDDTTRPLTSKGMRDRQIVTDYLADKGITKILSSPYRRAVDTVAHFAQAHGLEIETDPDFRERGKDTWLDPADFWTFIERQWSDFTYTASDGESLQAVQNRNLRALERALSRYGNQNIAIGTHGTALCTVIRRYDPAWGLADFKAMVHIMPWVVRMAFEGTACRAIEKIDVMAKAGQSGGGV